MDIKNRAEIDCIDDTCGRIQELYNSENLSVSYVFITGKAKSHLHRKTEEFYVIN